MQDKEKTHIYDYCTCNQVGSPYMIILIGEVNNVINEKE